MTRSRSAALAAVVWAWAWAWGALALGSAGCSSRPAYRCAASSQCVAEGQQGTCTDGFCAFGDPSCPGGMRYEPNAGDDLGGKCLPPPPDAAEPPDAAGPCGTAGLACCAAEGAACGDQTYCEGATCAPCATDLVLGRRFSCVLAHDHAVWCAGGNTKGQLGVGLAGAASATRAQVRDAAGTPITDAVAIGAGREHACAVRAGGAVWCWGANEAGQLGNAAAITVPPAPPTPPRPAAVLVVTGNGTPLANIVEVAGGRDFTCARDNDGGVWCWGGNGGALGDGTATSRSTAAPVLDAAGGAPLTGALELRVGSATACVRKAGDATWCWGRNGNGELGDGTTTSRTSPVLIATTKSMAPGMWHACYVEADSTISCAGANWHARLGIGTGDGYSDGDHLTKEKVLAARGGAAFTGAAKVAAGGETCALMQDTGVYCWGDNNYGQNGTGMGVSIPAKVRAPDGTPLTGVERLVAAYAHVCAIKTTGEILCWGRNNEGELGDGAFVNRGFPSRIDRVCR